MTEAPKPFAYFQWNSGWEVWEQVNDDAAGKDGVVAAYVGTGVDADALPRPTPETLEQRRLVAEALREAAE